MVKQLCIINATLLFFFLNGAVVHGTFSLSHGLAFQIWHVIAFEGVLVWEIHALIL